MTATQTLVTAGRKSQSSSWVRGHSSSTGAVLGRSGLTLFTWVIVLTFFFPVFWMVVTGFKPENKAATRPPQLFFLPTLEQYENIVSRGVTPFLVNSLVVSVASVVVVLALAVPAAYALSIKPIKKWRDALSFFLSTRMLPVAGAIAAIYLLARDLGLLDTTAVLILLNVVANLPIAIWMIRSFLSEIPLEVLEAARVDGAGFLRTMWSVILPMLAPGLASCALIVFIFVWNEFFLAVNLTSTTAATLPVFLVGFITAQGSFWAQLCAAATVCVIPVVIAGWVAQDKLVRGLTLGAVK